MSTHKDQHTDIKAFLAQHERTTKPIHADGTCLFRTFSKLTHGTQSHYEQVRAHLFAL